VSAQCRLCTSQPGATRHGTLGDLRPRNLSVPKIQGGLFIHSCEDTRYSHTPGLQSNRSLRQARVAYEQNARGEHAVALILEGFQSFNPTQPPRGR
jgi:hypothetical protein